MNKVYIDSNILIAWQIVGHPFNPLAQRLLKKLLNHKLIFCLSPLTIDEYLYAILKYQKANLIPKENSLQQSLKVIAKVNPFYVNIKWDQSALLSIYPLIEKYHLRPRDAFHLKIIQDNKIKYLASFDNDFKKVVKEGLVTDVEGI
ncbi:MAG: type II toxin-antitoxin system VapC family toxin [Microgenomates group bacterium]